MKIENLTVPLYHLELVRDRSIPYRKCGKLEEAAQVIHDELDRSPVEKLMVIYMDSTMSMVGAEVVAVGQLEQVRVSMREIFRGAIHAAVPRIILAHNHPSGDPTPSNPDINLTVQTVQAGAVVGIEVWDHIVVSPAGTHVSIFEMTQKAAIDRIQNLLLQGTDPLGLLPSTIPSMPSDISKKVAELLGKYPPLSSGK